MLLGNLIFGEILASGRQLVTDFDMRRLQEPLACFYAAKTVWVLACGGENGVMWV